MMRLKETAIMNPQRQLFNENIKIIRKKQTSFLKLKNILRSVKFPRETQNQIELGEENKDISHKDRALYI